MTKRMIIMLVVVAVVFGGVFGFIGFGHYMRDKFLHSMGFPPQTVSTTVATTQEWQPKVQGVGSLRAVNGADLSSQVAGTVSAIHFESGADVKAGASLVELASADDVAKLQSLKASAALAQITLDRDQKQLKVQGVSQQTIDTDAQNLKSAVAQVAEQQATLDYKNVRAPFDGRLGIRQVDLGQFLAAGTTMVTLQSLDPIFVDFYLPQQSLEQVKVGLQAAAAIDAFPGKTFPGEITAINPKVDAGTRNVQIRATLKNPDHVLAPGMYATVDIAAGAPQRYVTLPQTAISYNSFGSTVFIVNDKGAPGQPGQGQPAQGQPPQGQPPQGQPPQGQPAQGQPAQGQPPKGPPPLTVRQVFVTTGLTRGDQVAIVSGVNDGDTVISAGQLKLRNGAPIVVDNTVQPKSNPNPVPVDQ